MRVLKGLSFAVVWLVIVALLPQTAMANKRIYKAKIKNGLVTGSSLLRTGPDVHGWELVAYVRNVNNSVRQVWIVDAVDGFQLAVCGVAGAPELSCAHNTGGDLDFSTIITGGYLQNALIGADLIFQTGGALAPWSGQDWLDTLEAGEAEFWVLYDNDGTPPFTVATGEYIQIFP